MIVLFEFGDFLPNFLRVGESVVMFEVILDFFDGLGEHEFVLRDLHFHPSFEIVKALVNFDDFL